MKSLTLTVPDELIIEAKVKAAREGTSLSEVVRRWFGAWIEGEIPTPAEKKDEDEGKPTPAALTRVAA